MMHCVCACVCENPDVMSLSGTTQPALAAVTEVLSMKYASFGGFFKTRYFKTLNRNHSSVEFEDVS